jgi:hypothetical protein
VLAGRVNMNFDSYTVSEKPIKAAKVRALGVTSTGRLGALPQVPSGLRVDAAGKGPGGGAGGWSPSAAIGQDPPLMNGCFKSPKFGRARRADA